MTPEWCTVRLAEICEHSAFGPRFSGDHYAADGNVATLRTTDISEDGRIEYATMPRARLDLSKLRQHVLRTGDLVVTRSGRVGTAAVFGEFHLPVLPGAFLIRFRLNRQIAEPRFYHYYFNSPAGRVLLASAATGSVQQNLNITSLYGLDIPLPPASEQRSIAKLLGALDDKIELNRRMNETLEALVRTAFAKLARQTGRVALLGTVAEINAASIKPDSLHDSIEYVDIASVKRGRIEGTTTYQRSEAPSRARRLVRDGDVIWSCVRPNRRSHALIDHPPPNLVVSTGFAVLTPRAVPPSYLYAAVTTDEFVDYLVSNADGSAYPAVRPSHFGAAEVQLPSEEELRRFDDLAAPLLRRCAANERESKTLADLRDTLLPKLISGEIRVRDAEEAVETAG